jgi:hypothetical protein
VKVGEVYFIRERDRIDGGSSSYVKIGIVQDIARDSQQRLREHQTGNPRDLELHHVTQTPGPYRVERFLHQKFGPKRVRSEWFRFSDAELESAVQTAERMAEEAFVHIPIMKAAEELKSVVSTPDKIPPTDETDRWIRSLSVAKEAVNLCDEMSDSYNRVVGELSPDDRAQAEFEELVITEHRPVTKFDRDGFAVKYPGLLEQYTETSVAVTGTFRTILPDVDLAEADRELVDFCSDFQESCEKVRRNELTFGELFDLFQVLERFRGSYSWDKDVADANLRVICGSAAGIEGQATWNRAVKERSSTDLEHLESEHREKFNEFVTVEVQSRLITRRRARVQVNKPA